MASEGVYFHNLVPGPDAEMTEFVRGLGDAIASVAQGCRSIGPLVTLSDLKRAEAQMLQGMTYVGAQVEQLRASG